jgi:deoxyadenosine/deoxycytidine kinase
MAKIVVEGTIGVGKSAVLSLLRDIEPGWAIFPEPVEEWQAYTPQPGIQINFLGDFYAAPCERSFRLLQTQVINSLLRRYTIAENNPGVVTCFERSIRVAKEVFMTTNSHWWSMPETQQLQDLASWAVEHFEKDIHHVYLKCSSDRMLERVLARRRAAESSIK